MKFDFIIGNPPYQEEVEDSDNKTFMPPVYNLYMDEAYHISDRVELVHPARFLFNAGQTPKSWNEKMLADPHFKVLHYEPDGCNVFPTAEIKGGIAITYRDATNVCGAINTFTKFEELNRILQKIIRITENRNLTEIMYNQNRFNLDELYKVYPHFKSVIGSGGKDRRFRNNIFDKINLFSEKQFNKDDLEIIGVVRNKRQWRYFPKRFIDLSHENLYKWKVLIGAASGSGVFGETLSTPIILCPSQGYTQTYIGIGSFETEEEAVNLEKYIKTKLFRAMLGVRKITQHNDIRTFSFVPLQDFTSASDIDWSQSVADIDRQLYRKYGLDETEIAFIESHVKEMV
ncbi:MAG: Eco57I restriction-modification methylase domain-containing protein [Acutalibacteraceae bacterium]